MSDYRQQQEQDEEQLYHSYLFLDQVVSVGWIKTAEKLAKRLGIPYKPKEKKDVTNVGTNAR